jgi:hypothetical protein
MTDPPPVIHLQLTEEQKEILHRVTGEHAAAIELIPDAGDGTAGKGRGLHFSWRISVDSGIPRQQWILGGTVPPPAPDEGTSA